MYFNKGDGKKHLKQMMWGYLPQHVRSWKRALEFWNGYTNDKGKFVTGYITLNAIGEEILDKNKMWLDAALNRRCIMFSDGFYEWRHIFPLNKKTGEPLKTATKYPYHIHLKENNLPFIMIAGLWTNWYREEVDEETGEIIQESIPCFAITTTKANNLMAQIHNSKKRMPTILSMELALEWLDPNLSEQRILEIATYQYPPDKMEAYTIPKKFQSEGDPKEKIVYPDLTPVVC